MERESQGGATTVEDYRRDMGDETPGALRDAPPDILGPDRRVAPVSGHVVAPEAPRPSVPRRRSTTGRPPRDHLPGPPAGRHARPDRRRPDAGGAPGRLDPPPLAAARRRGAVRHPPSSTPSTPAGSTSSSTATTSSRGASGRPDPGRGAEEPRRVVGRRRPGPTRSPASGGCSRRTPARAGTPRGSSCRRSSTG